MHICQGVLSGFSHNDLFVLLVPFEDRSGSNPEFPANLGRDRNLALRGQSGMCKRHRAYITTVMHHGQRSDVEQIVQEMMQFDRNGAKYENFSRRVASVFSRVVIYKVMEDILDWVL